MRSPARWFATCACANVPAMDCGWMHGLLALATLGLGACTDGQADDGDGSGSSSAGSDTSGGADTQGPGSSGVAESTGPGTASSDGADSTTGGTGCALPSLTQDQIDNLQLWAGFDTAVPIGGSRQISLTVLAAGPPEPIEACVDWSVAPAEGASIDADGLVSVDASATAGTIYTVTADVEDGRRILTIDLPAYVPVEAPLVGFWSEVGQIPCMGPPDPVTPESIIYELQFVDTGDFRVTWMPFELYVDYWGTWTWDEGTGALSMTVAGGNYEPVDLDLDGTASVDEASGQLTLTDMWLGTPQGGVAPAQCGHVFE